MSKKKERERRERRIGERGGEKEREVKREKGEIKEREQVKGKRETHSYFRTMHSTGCTCVGKTHRKT